MVGGMLGPVTDLDGLRRDLAAEHEALDAVVAGLDEDGWAAPTPAEGWTVRDQVGHLAWFDRAATQAVWDPAAFTAAAAELAADPHGAEAGILATGRSMSGAALLGVWREGRHELLATLAGVDPSARIPWYGPPMGPASFVTARLMETWAHGQDVVDAVGADRPATDRLRHVADLGVRTRAWSYRVRGRPVPDGPVRVELTGPGGDSWAWGDEAAADTVTGPALDFCLVVTRRRHVADTALVAKGPLAEEWLEIAQAYAGPPGTGRGERRQPPQR
jgi:uncharacterized protein (TIGR03084 family)